VYGKPLAWISVAPSMRPAAPTIASHGQTSTEGSGSIGRAPSLSSLVKQSCMVRNRVFLASSRFSSAKSRQTPRDRIAHDRAAYTEWLRQLRAVLCTERKIALIFDEVFTGFRLAPGGAQEYFGVRADMVTFRKCK
jgi:hypothetical protein